MKKMEYLALFVIATVSHTGSARTWGGYEYDHPVQNHHNFNYNTWCHSAGGWENENSWEQNSSEESPMWNDNTRWISAGWDGDSWEDDNSGESNVWNDKTKKIRSTTTRRSVVITKTQTQDKSTITLRAASTGSTPSPLEVMLCLRMCQITPEYNPVCGTDNITYWNSGRLQCAISCGVNVELKRPSICPTGTLDSNPTSSTTTTASPQVIAACMRSCRVTSEYNPVCGTDNLTYNNPSRLECAKDCGKPVSVMLPSRCPPPDLLTSITSTPASTSTSSFGNPITINTSVGPTPNPGSNTTSSRNSTENTISPDILGAIFNTTATTTEYVPDFSLDERFERQIDINYG